MKIVITLAAVFFFAACASTGGKIGVPTEEQDTGGQIQTTGYAAVVSCDGVECAGTISTKAALSIRLTPAADPSDITATLSCIDPNTNASVDYPLTLSSTVTSATSVELFYDHADLPYAVDCVMTVSENTSSASISKETYLGEGFDIEIPFSTMCSTDDDFSNPNTLERCWSVALMQMGGAVFFIGSTDLEAIRSSLGFTVEYSNGALVLKAPDSSYGFFLVLYKKFGASAAPSISYEASDAGLLNDDGVGTQEVHGPFVADVSSYPPDVADIEPYISLERTCTMTTNFRGMFWPGGPYCTAIVDSPGIGLIQVQFGIASCGIDPVNDPDWNDKLNDRIAGVAFSDAGAFCDTTTPFSGELGITNGWRLTYDGNDWLFNGLADIESQFFDASNGAIAGIIYGSSIDETTVGEPFELTIEGVDFDGATAIGGED